MPSEQQTRLNKHVAKSTQSLAAPIDGQVTVDASAMSSTDKPVIKIATQKKNIQGKVTEYDDKLQTGRSNSDDRWFRQISASKIVSIAQTPIAKMKAIQ